MSGSVAPADPGILRFFGFDFLGTMPAPAVPLPAGFAVFLFLVVVIVSFLSYWLTIESAAVRGRFEARYGRERGSLRFFVFNKLWGFLWFGVVCTAAALLLFPGSGVADFGLILPRGGAPAVRTLLWCVVLVPACVFGGFRKNRKIARAGGNFGRYPEIRVSEWTNRTVAIHVGLWSLYLLAYELMFRGTLLFPLAAILGIWPAIGINTALYSAFHVPKGAGEAVGALFLGFLLCLITLSTGSIVVAFLVHVALAVSNGLFAFRFRPDMSYTRVKSGPEQHGRLT